MKNKLSIIGMVLFSLLAGLGSALLSLSNSPDLGMAIVKFTLVSMSASYIAQYITGVSLYSNESLLYCNALIGVKRKCNNLTMGGIKRLYIVLCEDLTADFLGFNLALTDGEFAGAIPLVVGKKFVEVEAWYDTTKIDGEMKSGSGFTQGIEFKILGYDKDIVKFQTLLYDTPINLIAQGNDDRLYYIGTKYSPIILDAMLVVPEKGTARKEVTFKGKQDGLQNPPMPLASTVTFDVTVLV